MPVRVRRGFTQGRDAWCNWGEAFASVVGNGVASVVTDVDEKIRGLQLLIRQQMGRADVPFTPRQAAAVTVWKVTSTYFRSIPSPLSGRNSGLPKPFAL